VVERETRFELIDCIAIDTASMQRIGRGISSSVLENTPSRLVPCPGRGCALAGLPSYSVHEPVRTARTRSWSQLEWPVPAVPNPKFTFMLPAQSLGFCVLALVSHDPATGQNGRARRF
jgi:hypothetical protein